MCEVLCCASGEHQVLRQRTCQTLAPEELSCPECEAASRIVDAAEVVRHRHIAHWARSAHQPSSMIGAHTAVAARDQCCRRWCIQADDTLTEDIPSFAAALFLLMHGLAGLEMEAVIVAELQDIPVIHDGSVPAFPDRQADGGYRIRLHVELRRSDRQQVRKGARFVLERHQR